MRTNRGVLAGVLLLGVLTAASSDAQAASRLGLSFTAISAFVKGSAVAYDPKNSKYLVVSAYGDLNGRFVSADGALLGAPFTIQAGAVGFAHFPGLAYSPDANGGAGGFLVAWHQSVAVGAVVFARTVSTTGALGPVTQLTADGSWWEAIVDVAYSTVSKEFFVVWQAAGIRAQRVSNTGGLLGANIFVTGTNYHRDPSVAYNPVANEFMVVYAGDDGVSPFVGARRVAAGSGALVGSQTLLSRAVGTYITEVAYNSRANTYLAAWYQGGTYGRILDAAGTATTGVLLLATRFSAYDALGIDYSATSGTYMMVSHDTASLQDGAVELSAGAVPGLGFVATDAPTTKGNYYPKIAARSDKAEWLMSTATSFAATTLQRLQSTATGGGGAPAPLTVRLTSNIATGIAEGEVVSLSATPSGGKGPYTYQFWKYTAGVGWSIAQDYSALNTYGWAPTAGTHAVQVRARNSGSTAEYDAYGETGLFTVARPAARLTSLTANVSFPSAPNVPITFTAQATGGTAPLQYQFWLYREGSGWSVVQPYSSFNTYTWFPVAGTYAFQVWVRGTGSTAQYEDWRSSNFFTVGSSPVKISNLRVNRTFPAATSTPITWTATASGGSGPLDYKFWLFSTITGWSVLQDWSATSHVTWTPGVAYGGQHALQVWVRSRGSAAQYEDWQGTDWFSITDSTSLTLATSLNLNTYGVSNGCVVFTAATAGPGVWEYQFWTNSNSTWTVRQTYSGFNTFGFCPVAGTHAVQVWTRRVGASTTLWERWATTGFFVVRP